VILRVAEIHGVHDQPDVGAVLARHAAGRDLDQLDRRLVQRVHVLLVVMPVGIGPLDHDLALLQQTLQQQVDVEALVGVAQTERDVVEVEEEGQVHLLILRHAEKSFRVGSGRRRPSASIVRMPRGSQKYNTKEPR